MPHLFSRSSRRFFGVSSFQILAMFRRGMFYAYLSVYLRYFLNLSVTETTLFATLPMLANIIFQATLWGRLSDRYQLRRTLIFWGEILGGFGTLAVWFVHTLPENHRTMAYVIIFGLTIVEIFWSMSNIGWSALISDLYPPEKRGAVQGKLTSAGAIGRIAGVWIGGLLYDGLGRYYEGWGFEHGALFFVAAGVMFVSTIPLLLEGNGVRLSGFAGLDEDIGVLCGTANNGGIRGEGTFAVSDNGIVIDHGLCTDDLFFSRLKNEADIDRQVFF